MNLNHEEIHPDQPDMGSTNTPDTKVSNAEQGLATMADTQFNPSLRFHFAFISLALTNLASAFDASMIPIALPVSSKK
jgi:hypothetical protein